MRIFINLFLISIGSIFGSVYLNKRYEEMVPMTVMSIIFILFIFYMLNIVLIGYYLILAISAAILILCGIKFIKEKDIRKQALANFFTPGLLIFASLALIIYFVTKNNFVMLFDELRMWALYPKSVFITNKLMIGSNLFFSTDYYPGMPLFQYFFAKNAGYFSESHLYLSYALVVLSLLIPITKKIKWKNFWAIIPMIILLFTFPMLFANSGFDAEYYYRSLFIDPALGITFGYALYLSTKDLKNDKYKYVLFCLSVSTIILMKVVGIVLAGCVILSYLFNQIFIYKSYKLKLKKENLKGYIKLLLPIIFVIFTFFSWQIVVKERNSSDIKSEQTATNRISDSFNLFFSPTEKQKTFINSYVSYIKENRIVFNENSYSSKITVPNVTILFLIIMLFLFFSVDKEKKKIIFSSSIFGVISIFIFLCFYLYIYVFTFNSTILCYGRYIGTVISGISIFTLMLIFDVLEDKKYKQLYYFLVVILLLLYIQNIPKLSTYEYDPNAEVQTNILSDKITSIIGEKNENVKILTIYNYCDTTYYSCVLYQHHLFLSLVDNGIYPLSSGMYMASEGVVPPSFYIPINYDNIDLYIKNFDYVLIVEDIQNIEPDSKKLFGKYPKAGDFFKKNVDKNGNISMEKLSV